MELVFTELTSLYYEILPLSINIFETIPETKLEIKNKLVTVYKQKIEIEKENESLNTKITEMEEDYTEVNFAKKKK